MSTFFGVYPETYPAYTGTQPGNQLATPANMRSTNVSYNALSVAADPVANATGYVFELATNSAFTAGLVTSATQTSPAYSFVGLYGLTNYYQRVRAIGNGTSYTDSNPSAAVQSLTMWYPGPAKRANVVFRGNSIDAGTADGASGTEASMNGPSESGRLLPPGVIWYNEAIPGQTMTQIRDRVATQLDAHYDATPGVENISYMCEATNFLNTPGATGAQYFALVQQDSIDARAKGWKTVIRTTTPVGVANNAKNAEIIAANNLIRANAADFDDVIDVELNAMVGTFPSADGSVLGSADNPAYYYDGTHPRQIVQQAIGRMYFDSINKLVYGVSPKPSPAAYPLAQPYVGNPIAWTPDNGFKSVGSSAFEDGPHGEFQAYGHSADIVTGGVGRRRRIEYTAQKFTANFFTFASSITNNFYQYQAAAYGLNSIWEGSGTVGNFGGAVMGDRIGVEAWGTLDPNAPIGTPSNTFLYFKNGQLWRTSDKTPAFPLTVVVNVGAQDRAPNDGYIDCYQA